MPLYKKEGGGKTIEGVMTEFTMTLFGCLNLGVTAF